MGRVRGAMAAVVIASAVVLPLALPPASAADDPPHAGTSCQITDPRVDEASGLAVTDDRMYVVNDGGDQVTVFEMDRSCHVVRVLTNPTDPYDVEDLARSADGRLWLADIGDNRQARSTVAIEVLAPSGSVTLYRFAYPDRAHDAEALLLDPRGRPYIVTKDALGVSGVYTSDGAPAPGRTVPLRKVTTLRLHYTGTSGGPVGPVSQVLVTGGAVSPDGTRLALRTYTDLYLWSVRDGDIAAALRDDTPTRVALPKEKQGESVAFAPDGRTVLTTSEGSPAPVHTVTVPQLGTAPGDRTDSSRPTPTAPTTRHTAGSGSGRPSEASNTGHDGSSRPLWLNGLLAAVIATVIVSGLGRLRRK